MRKMSRAYIDRVSASMVVLALLAGWVSVAFGQDLEERDGKYYRAGTSDLYSGAVEDVTLGTGFMADGVRTGEWTWYGPDGNPLNSTVFAGGQRIRVKNYHANGAVSSDWSFTNEIPDGFARSWNMDGSLKEELIFRNGRRHGPYTIHYADGALLYEAAYSDGVLNGPATWYYQDGTKHWETEFANGQKSGVWVQYGPGGNRIIETEWVADQLVARHTPDEHAGH